MKYSKVIETLCDRLDRRAEHYITLKANVSYKIERDNDTIRLYHYGTLLGGVRLTDERNLAILGSPRTTGDKLALNTLWKHYMCGRRVYKRNGKIVVESMNECTDNDRV